MASSEIKARVAQNCHGYTTKYSMELINSITYGSESCNSCVKYMRGKCTEGLFDGIMEIVMIN